MGDARARSWRRRSRWPTSRSTCSARPACCWPGPARPTDRAATRTARVPARRARVPQRAAGRARRRRLRPRDRPAAGLLDLAAGAAATGWPPRATRCWPRSPPRASRSSPTTATTRPSGWSGSATAPTLSHERMQAALDAVWPLVDELFPTPRWSAGWPRPVSASTRRRCAPRSTRCSTRCSPPPRCGCPAWPRRRRRGRDGAGDGARATRLPASAGRAAERRPRPSRRRHGDRGRARARPARSPGRCPTPSCRMLTLADLGILRDVERPGRRAVVTITPTYSRLPGARRDRATTCVAALRGAGYADVEVRTVLTPGLDHRLDHRRRAGGSSPRPASPRPGRRPPRRPGRCRSRSPEPARGRLPALRLAGHRAAVRVRRDRLPGAVPLPDLPRAVRACEGDLRCRRTGRPRASRRRSTRSRSPRVDRLCADAAAVTFDVPDELAERFAFLPGQSLTVRRRRGRRRRASLVLDLRAAGARAAHRRARGARRRWCPAGWSTRCGRATRSRWQPPSGTFTPDLDTPAHHVLHRRGLRHHPGALDRGLGARRPGQPRRRSCTATGAPTR